MPSLQQSVFACQPQQKDGTHSMQAPPHPPRACPGCGPNTTWSCSSKQTKLRCTCPSSPGTKAANRGARDYHAHLILAAADRVPKGVETWQGYPLKIAARLGTNGQWEGRIWCDTKRSQQGQCLRGHRHRFGGCPGAVSTSQRWSCLPDSCEQPALQYIILGPHTMYMRMLCRHVQCQEEQGVAFLLFSFLCTLCFPSCL